VIFRALADAVVALHAAFVAFVALGGFLALRWRRLWLLQLPCAVYGVLVELLGWICPLTPLENALRRLAGEAGYAGGFVEHHLLPLLYPEPFPRTLAWTFAAVVVAANVAAYALLVRGARRSGEVTGGRVAAACRSEARSPGP
jgi:hypothetical protein